ncbi:MAG: G-D-S-L family lipolytic protein, partial [Gammaproteobacteria bacterium]|nr:G-D-S-L family lipolytic protein [Gammaproteobacteria bacterium]
ESIAGVPTTEVTSVLTGSFNNMGVPGAKSYHLVAPNYGDPGGVLGGTANPYFARFASSTTTDMITDAASQLPSFYVLWIGNNDILSYATSGGIGVDQTGTFAGGTGLQPSGYGSNDITDPEAFAAIYSGLLAAMNTTATGGVLVNIPDVSAIPYFTTVPYNAVPLDQTTADTLNSMVAYGAYNAGLDLALATPLCVGATGITQQEVDARKITFAAAPNNAVVIEDESLTDLTVCDPQLVSMRQATANDLIVLPSSSKIGTLAVPGDPNSAWGVGVPLEDGDVLIPAEITAIDTARAAYNATISAAATADPNLILLDAAAIIDEINDTGINYGTGSVTSDFATGGAFSLDGVHPTARGYAIAANRMIDAINTGFNANIPPVDPGTYTTIFIK